MFSRIKFNSPVILSFVFISLISLLLGLVTNNASTKLFFSVYRSSPINPLTYIRLFTHVLGHIDWSHYINNMLIILVVGPLLEEKYGSANIVLIIIATAFFSGIANMIMFPQTKLLGASGVVFAFILLSSITSFDQGKIPLTFLLVAVIYIGGQILSAIMVQDNISNTTHIIGGIIGSVFGYFINNRGNSKSAWEIKYYEIYVWLMLKKTI